jgi:hypothetical protein
MIDLNENLKISRYLDLTKLLDFIQFDRLYFRQFDKYDYVFEGSFPKIIYELAKSITITGNDGVSTNKGITETTKLIRQSTYVSCWTANDSESMAMWNLYGGKNGLCIHTNTSIVMEELLKAPHKNNEKSSTILRLISPRVSRIRYVDHLKSDIDFNAVEISDYPIIYKNIGFSYEDEIRFFYDMRQQSNADLPKEFGEGFHLSIDSKSIIEKVLVSPSADYGFFDNVKKLLSHSGLENRVEWSSLKNPPYKESEFF